MLRPTNFSAIYAQFKVFRKGGRDEWVVFLHIHKYSIFPSMVMLDRAYLQFITKNFMLLQTFFSHSSNMLGSLKCCMLPLEYVIFSAGFSIIILHVLFFVFEEKRNASYFDDSRFFFCQREHNGLGSK